MTSSFLHFQSGVIEFHEELPVQSVLSQSHNPIPSHSVIPLYHANTNSRIVKGTRICLLLLPSHMIPCDILKYITKEYLDKILSIQILHHIGINDDKYLALLEVEDESSAVELIRDFNNQPLSSLEQILCVLYSVKTMKLATANDGNSDFEYEYDCHRQEDRENNSSNSRSIGIGIGGGSSSSNKGNGSEKSNKSNSNRNSVKSNSNDNSNGSSSNNSNANRSSSMDILDSDLVGVSGLAGTGRYLISSPSVSSTFRRRARAASLIEMKGEDKEDDAYCPVCLESISSSRPCSFTTACRHTYHIECIGKLEGPQCPVCR